MSTSMQDPSASRKDLEAGAPLLVMLPGLDGTGKLFKNFIAQLGTRINVRVIGYPVDEALGYEELVSWVERRLPATPYFLLAESFSGPVGILAAARASSDLKGLILCGTFASNPFPGLGWAGIFAPLLPIKSLPRWFRSLMLWGSGSWKRAPANVDRAIAPVKRHVITHRIRAVFRADVRDCLNQIGAAVLILSAPEDQIVRRSAARQLVSGIPGAHHVEIAGPHLLLQARPAECASAVLKFIERHTAADARSTAVERSL